MNWNWVYKIRTMIWNLLLISAGLAALVWVWWKFITFMVRCGV